MRHHRIPHAAGPGMLPIRQASAVCGLLLVQLMTLSEVVAQTAVPRPTITRAFDLFETYPERVSVGTDIVFKTKASQGAKNLVRSGLQVRVFSLRDEQAEPSPVTTIDDCDVYLSAVYPIAPPTGTDVRFQTMDHGWLNLSNSLNSIKDGRYFLVFEQAGPTGAQFRLKSADASSYFSSGFRVVVFDSGSVSLDAVRSEYLKRRDLLGRLYQEVDKRSREVPCYTYRRLTAGLAVDLELAQASLEFCAPQANAVEVM